MGIVLKLDLRNEALSADGYGVALVLLNVGVPLGLLVYYCVPTLVDRSTLGDAGRARQVFELLDVDGVGFVTRDQVRQLLQATNGILAGDAVTEDELDRSFTPITDQTSNGPTKVSAAEWPAYVRRIYSTSGEREALFQIIAQQINLKFSRDEKRGSACEGRPDRPREMNVFEKFENPVADGSDGSPTPRPMDEGFMFSSVDSHD